MQEKKMTHKDAIEKSAYDAMIYKNIIKQISTKELKKALKMLKEMPKTRTKIRLIEQELRVREQGEVKTRGGLPIALLNEWDRVTGEIRKRVKKWDSTSEST